MFKPVLIAAALLVGAPAIAADTADATPVVKTGKTLRDSNNVRIGKIDRVYADGSVRVINDNRFVTIPADAIAMVDGQPTTTLSKREVTKLP